MKKIFSAMVLPLMAMMLLITGCQDSKIARLKAEINKYDSQCPVDMGMLGSLSGVDFDDEERLIVYKYTVDEDALDTNVDELVDDDDITHEWMAMVFSTGDGKKFAEIMIDAGVGVKAIFKGKRSGTTSTVVLPVAEIKSMLDNPMSADERNARTISVMVDSNKSQCPMEVDEGMTMVDVFDDGKNVVFVYDVDEDIYDIDVMASNYLTMKNEMKSLFKTDAMFKSIGAQVSEAGYGMSYRYKGATSGKYVDVTLTPGELR